MKKIVRSLLCVVLMLSMTAGATLPALAAGQQEYVSEIKMAICNSLEDAKNELPGYTVVENDLNKDQGNGAQAVYLGYKTTKDKDEAITDLRMMDMNGGYSYNDYDKALEQMAEDITEEINSFFDAIKEFRKNKKENKFNAYYAYSQMNEFKDDDQNGKLIGDVFIDESVTAESLQTIFLEGNAASVLALEELLAIGCSDDWIERLKSNLKEIYDADAYILEPYCETVRLMWQNLYLGLKGYEEQLEGENGFDVSDLLTVNSTGSNVSFSTEAYEEWLKTNPSEEQKHYVYTFGTAYNILSSYDYKGGTLLDYFMVPLEEVDYEYLYPIADALTKGQLQTLKYVGLEKCIAYSKTDFEAISPTLSKNADKIANAVIETANEYIDDEDKKIDASSVSGVVSIYEGVDRSLFIKDSGVALTNDALRKCNSSDDKSAIVQVLNNAKWYLTGVVAIGAVACGICGALIGIGNSMMTTAANAYIYTAEQWATIMADFAEGNVVNFLHPEGFSTAMSEAQQATALSRGATMSGAGTVFLGIAIGATLIFIGLSIYKGYDKYMNHRDYKTVPMAIVNQKTIDVFDSYNNKVGTKDFYYAYYPVEDSNPDGNHGDYADMNGWKAQQWNVMYYTKDKRAGSPILANTFVVQYGNDTKPSGYTAFSEFGLTAAADINRHAFSKVPGIYLFYQTTADATGTASTFVNGYYAITALGGLVAGVGATLGIGSVVLKKKRAANVPAEA